MSSVLELNLLANLVNHCDIFGRSRAEYGDDVAQIYVPRTNKVFRNVIYIVLAAARDKTLADDHPAWRQATLMRRKRTGVLNFYEIPLEEVRAVIELLRPLPVMDESHIKDALTAVQHRLTTPDMHDEAFIRNKVEKSRIFGCRQGRFNLSASQVIIPDDATRPGHAIFIMLPQEKMKALQGTVWESETISYVRGVAIGEKKATLYEVPLREATQILRLLISHTEVIGPRVVKSAIRAVQERINPRLLGGSGPSSNGTGWKIG